MKHFTTTALALCLALPAGAWTLDGDASVISYVSIKNAETAEANLLTGLSGHVDEAGKAQVDIALSSVETFIDIRNERVRDHLFRVADFPLATVTADLDLDDVSGLAAGATTATTFDITLAANGTDAVYEATALVTRVGADRVVVTSQAPVIVYAEDFGYETGIAKLQEIAGLDSIQLVVPVSFTLNFAR